ncbi:MAG TPA: ABC transporter ATP-binding protein [Methylophilaceae bacterium]|nr:ABC transporter ATP-binding protein [Methylophilaceae bacterium]
MPDNKVIEINHVSRRFGAIQAVDDVSLNIVEGETLGLIGHNGAGKSTLFKMMLGLIPPTSGSIHIQGTPVRGRAFRELRRRIGYLPENLAFYDNLSGLETLQFFASLKGVADSGCLPLLHQVGLSHAIDRRVDGYSKGMRQRLGFAQALLGNPRFLFLDEPTNGLDPEGIREFYRQLRELNERGVTVVITSHILAEIQERVTRLAVMRTGKLQALGTVQQLREEVDLPLTIRLTLQSSSQVLDDVLASADIESLEVKEQTAVVRCHRAQKMDILRRINTLGDGVLDLDVLEPSLEDVFLGYAHT